MVKTPLHKAVAVFLFVLTLSLLSGGKAHAASITVNTDTNPSLCTLDEAIQNINNQAQTNTDCVETGSFGTNDTITIPSGQVILSGNLQTITRSVVIAGAGMGITTIDGVDSSYDHIDVQGSGTEEFKLTGLTLKNLHYSGVQVADANFVADQVEVYGSADVDGVSTDMAEGIVFQNNNPSQDLSVSLTNIHVHHLYSPVSSAMNGILISGNSNTGATTLSMNNITVDNLHSSTMDIVNGVALSMFNGVEHDINGSISNVTVTDLENTQSATGVALVGLGAATGILDMNNVTISRIHGSLGQYGGSGGIAISGGTSAASSTINARNVVVNDVLTDSTPSGCIAADLTSLIGGSGVPSLTINSLGGNLSDDTTCSPYFTQTTDRNNITNLASTLGSLSDNGGYVPTIPLLQGSPAIDSGVTVAGLMQDARLAARPQGTAYDSGAYESPFTKPAVATLASTGENIKLFAVIGGVLVIVAGGLVFTSRRKVSLK